MKTKYIIAFFSLFLYKTTISQINKPVIKTSKGDEQGLEVPKSLVLQQDKDAYAYAMKTWYPEDKKSNPHRTDWFADAHFGCFVHWGVYAALAGEWKGKGSLGYGEHIMRSRTIPLAEYKEKVVATFNPALFDADAWMKTASDAGMKYFIITAKHHDGFAMYNSDVYPYDIRQTQFKRDPMRELAAAAKKYGIKFGFYYSHAFDWEHPDAPGNDWDYNNPGGDKLLHGSNWWESYPEFLPNAEKYVNEKSIPQIMELINNYHPDILWFDTPHKLPMYLNLKIIKAIRDADPSIVVNGRLARIDTVNFGDYTNPGDRTAFFRLTQGLWEAVPTTNESYGYNKFDSTHKPAKHFIRLLSTATAKGGNILLNLGPKGDGNLDAKDVAIFKGIGAWMDKNKEAIYGTMRSPLAVQSWGEVTQKGNSLYLHVFDWPKDGNLVIGGLKAKIKKAFFLSAAKHKSIQYTSLNETDLQLSLPAIMPDTICTVIKLECENIQNGNATRLLSATNSNTLLVFDASTPGKGFSYGDGKVNRNFATNWKSKEQYLEWDVRLNQDTKFNLSLQYNTAAKTDEGVVVLDIDGNLHTIQYQPTENSSTSNNIYIKDLSFKAGIHKIMLKLENYKGTQAMQPMSVMLDVIK